MNKKNKWRLATFLLATLLLLSLHPEVRVLGMFIEVLGLDIYILLIETQLLLIAGTFHRHRIKPALIAVNAFFERADSFYFIPSRALIRTYPPIVLHMVPFLVTTYCLVITPAFLYS